MSKPDIRVITYPSGEVHVHLADGGRFSCASRDEARWIGRLLHSAARNATGAVNLTLPSGKATLEFGNAIGALMVAKMLLKA